MSGWLYYVVAGIYFVGAREATRMIVLHLIESNQRHRDTCKMCKSHKKYGDYPMHFRRHGKDWQSGDTVVAVFVSVFWPMFAFYFMVRFTAKYLFRFLRWLTFPKGMETNYARDKRLAAEEKKRVKERKRTAEEIRRLEAACGLPSLDLTAMGAFVAELTADTTIDSRPQKLSGGKLK